MVVDAVASPSGNLAEHDAESGVVDLAGAPAARADHMVVVRSLAYDIGMVATRQVQPLHGAEGFQDLECSEHRGAPDAKMPLPRFVDELARGEVPVAMGNEIRQRPPRLSQAVSGAIEGLGD